MVLHYSFPSLSCVFVLDSFLRFPISPISSHPFLPSHYFSLPIHLQGMDDSSKSSLHSVESVQSVSNPAYDIRSEYEFDEIEGVAFQKIRLATHLLTGQKCAIQIIDKKKIGKDLSLVKTRVEALKTLQHQNICRLYQEIETEEKIFLVMEYCAGGEMFDYIVCKHRLEESEARLVFIQLVQAVAFIHDEGFAHRDLKPESLLLTEDLHLKVIDLDYCSKYDGQYSNIESCSGSFAYSAPEQVVGCAHGIEVDIWSMGVILYALLCGSLPFDDDSIEGLYHKILKGTYPVPDHLTESSRQLLSKMLQLKPRNRITVIDLLSDPWLNDDNQIKIKWSSVYDKSILDLEVVEEMSLNWRRGQEEMHRLIEAWRFDYTTSTYIIMQNKKAKGEPFYLPAPEASTDGLPLSSPLPTVLISFDDDDHPPGRENELERFPFRQSVSRPPPEVVANEKGMNLSITSSFEPHRVKQQIIRLVSEYNMHYEAKGWMISVRDKDPMGFSVRVLFEIVNVEGIGKVAVRRTRLYGDAFHYKRVCERLLSDPTL